MNNQQVTENKTIKNGTNGDQILTEIKNRKKQSSKEDLNDTKIKEAVSDKDAVELLLEQSDEGLIRL